jgi:hypothetical protein
MASDVTSEQDIVAALAVALAPVPVWWGYTPQETAEAPPVLPVVVVVRLSAMLANWADMCEDDEQPADVSLQVRVWHNEYAEARQIQTIVRATMRGAAGWVEQHEFDTRDGDLRAWLIASDWLAEGAALE